MSEVSERISALVKDSGMSLRQVALKTGVSPMTVSAWVYGKSEPGGTGAKKLGAVFNVSPSWILFGDDEGFEVSSKIALSTISIPMLNLDASCGGGSFLPDAYEPVQMRHIGVNESFINLYCRGANPKKLVLIHAVGDSMLPTICDGDPVLVDISQKTIIGDGIYAVNYGNQLFIKRIQIQPNGKVIILSDNTNYQPIEVCEQDHIEVFGKAYAAVFIKPLTGVR